MDSRMEFVLDPEKCLLLSIEERREVIHELLKTPENAFEILQQWSRRDILEILCAEMGKERKYTGLSKQKMIEHLFKIVSEKRSEEHKEDKDVMRPPPSITQTPAKRQRKTNRPSRLPVTINNLPVANGSGAPNSIRCCKNLACRAHVNPGDPFCKRCSCCICHKYDDNKDPSLWLVCGSETLTQGISCGLSCHLFCALNDERCGIKNHGKHGRLDGSYYCISCGTVNDLLGCWRKQLIFAKDARRVDVLCQRVSLGHKLLCSTEKYQSLYEIVDVAKKKLESEVGPLDDASDMARGIVNRLPVGAEVQKLCSEAIELLDYMRPMNPVIEYTRRKVGLIPANFINFEDVSLTSITVVVGPEDTQLLPPELIGYNLWHKKAGIVDYPTEPTCTLSRLNRKFTVTELHPGTEYVFKIIAFSIIGEMRKWEAGITTEAIKKDETKCSNIRSGLSNSTPGGGDASSTVTILGDLNKLPENWVGYSEKPDVLDFEKSCGKSSAGVDATERDESDKSSTGTEALEQETTGHSGSALDEERNSTVQTDSQRGSTNSLENNQASDIPKLDNDSNAPIENQLVVVPYRHPESTLPPTSCRLEAVKELSGKGCKSMPSCSGLDIVPRDTIPGSSLKKTLGSSCKEIPPKDGSPEGVFEYCVKLIRWLECEGHIETDFRKKFLTWFSLRATTQQKKIVSVYVDTMIDDPGSLAGQLVDTFSGTIYGKKPSPAFRDLD